MFEYIKGTVEYKGTDYFVLENNGIGYRINSSLSTINKLELGKQEKILIYMQVREDYLGLIGFLTPEEKKVFELLLAVSGVGPKLANSVLSSLTPSRFSLAVVANDATCLKGVPGIGLKTAERIILELKDKMKKEDLLKTDIKVDALEIQDDTAIEAVKVLQVLGYSMQDAKLLLTGVDISNMETEDIVKAALKNKKN